MRADQATLNGWLSDARRGVGHPTPIKLFYSTRVLTPTTLAHMRDCAIKTIERNEKGMHEKTAPRTVL